MQIIFKFWKEWKPESLSNLPTVTGKIEELGPEADFREFTRDCYIITIS